MTNVVMKCCGMREWSPAAAAMRSACCAGAGVNDCLHGRRAAPAASLPRAPLQLLLLPHLVCVPVGAVLAQRLQARLLLVEPLPSRGPLRVGL